MSGLLRPKWLPTTELFRGFADPPKYGFVETTTPPETGVGPEGTLPERGLAVTSMPLAPRSAMPIPEKFLSNCAARHERVLSSTVLPFTSKSPTGWDGKASKNMPAQLSWIVFPAKEPRWAPATQMPHGPPEMRLPTTLASLLARPGPRMAMPVLPERLTSLERILVPGESTTNTPRKVSGLPITWLFATVVLTLPAVTIPLATLPVARFPTTVELRAPVTSITNAVGSPPFPAILKPRIVKPETLTSLTRCPSSFSVLRFTSPRTQIASGPKAFEQGESALAVVGAWITASSPRSFIPSLRITTSSL